IESATERKIRVGVPIGVNSVAGVADVTAHRRLCDAPCTLYVPPGSFTFNSAVNDLSYDTEIDVAPRGTRLRMRTPSRGRAQGGLFMINGGLALAAVGVTFIILGSIRGSNERTAWYASGGAVGGVGIGLLGGGIYLLATNRSGIEHRQDF